MKVLLCIFTFLAIPNSSAQEFSRDSCYAYYKGFQDKLLLKYLYKVKVDNLTRSDQIIYLYYKSLVNRVESNQELSVKYLVEGYDLVERYGAPDSIRWRYLDEFAVIYKRAESSNRYKALDYVDEAIQLKLKSNGSDDDVAKSYIIKANIFNSVEEKIDSALYYFRLAFELNTREANKYLILGSMASVSLTLNKLDSVESYLKQAIGFNLKNNQFKASVLNTTALAEYYSKTGNVLIAKSMLDSLVQRCHDNKWNNSLKSTLRQQIKLSKSIKDFESQVFWTDSLSAFNARHFDKRITELTEKYTLENKLANANAATYKNRFWLSVLGGTTGTLCLFLFGMYKYFALKRQKVEEALEAAKIRAAFDATKAKMEGELKERESIASVLHDQVASLLTAADLHLNVASKKDPSAQGITKAVSLIRDINNHVRDLSHQLVSPALIKFGLEAGIDSMIERMETSDLHITYVSKLEDRRYSSSLEAFVFQSASEFLHNVLKHSTATQAKLYISEEREKILLSVSDNGDNSQVSPKASTGLGLTHINARAAALDGHFSFTLRPNGAESLLEVPVVAAE